ncbi:MAG: glycoside hydrolase family 88 protein [Rikenellaceae bacterium]|jgi:rhamnogalacturonyl hydrolase YesR|nr:glycoside hydrolase family 88 protein [Rikenellaceae bacterium]
MRKTILIVAAALLTGWVASPAQAQQKPKKADVLKALTVANDYYMKRWPDPGEGMPYPSRARVYPGNIWTRAVYFEGEMALYNLTQDKRLLDYATLWGERFDWDLNRGYTTRNADNQCCGQVYLELCRIDPQPRRMEIIRKSIDAMMDSTRIDDWTWIDAIQMAMPVFARLGTITGDRAYFERMYDMYNYTKTRIGDKGLYNPVDRLWWRDADFDPPYVEPNGEDCYWSRGNGWVVAAMVRVLEIIPTDEAHRSEYVKMLRDMCSALVPLQRPDGFWNVSLHDPTHFGGKELTGTALFVYGMAYGVNAGLLDAKTYRPVIYRAWSALVKDCLHRDGFLGYVQGTGKEPKDGQPVRYTSMPDFEDYGLGCFLLAGTEVYKMK